MMRPRVIPCLLLKNTGLVKTVRFKDPTYLGDPINIVRIFNDKEVDELLFLDITATAERRGPPFEVLAKITEECFVPFGYGGGITRLDEVKRILGLGVEKVALNTQAVESPDLVRAAADLAGSQSVVVSIDVKKNWRGRQTVHTHAGQKDTGLDPVKHALAMQAAGAGEIFLNSIDRDGTMQGYDLPLVRRVAEAVGVPVVACGGAGSVADLASAIRQGGAAAAAAGSLFVFQGRHRAVLISYPTWPEMERALGAAPAQAPGK